jgi:hypothetical protein
MSNRAYGEAIPIQQIGPHPTKSENDMIDLTGLSPELHSYVSQGRMGWRFDHPLHIDRCLEVTKARPPMEFDGSTWPGGFQSINAAVDWKISEVAAARSDGKWHSFVFLHERPYRIDALLEVIEIVGIDRVWRLVESVWSDTESAAVEQDAWSDIWSRTYRQDGNRKKRSLRMMTAGERRKFDAMPDILTVWRGCSHPDAIHGFSWTMDKEMATWFAHRHGTGKTPFGPSQGAILAEMQIHKSIALAYFEGRKESEIVLDARYIDQSAFTWEILPTDERKAA